MNRTEQNGASKPTKARFAMNDKNNLRILRAAIEENLAEIAAELGITVKTGSISFEGDGEGCKVQLIVKTAGAAPEHEKNFAKYWRLFAHEGLLESHFGAEVTIRGEKHTIAGLLPNRSKFPIVVKSVATGKEILVTTVILRQLNPLFGNSAKKEGV